MKISQELIELITQIVVKEFNKAEKGRIVNPNHASTVSIFKDIQIADTGKNPKEVVIGVGPAYGWVIKKTINNLNHDQVLKEIMAGIEEEGMIPRIIRVNKTSDVAFIGKEAAWLSGSGVSIGLQSKGTAVIHQKDLYPLTNLELFPQAPLLSIEIYRHIGKNAARYAKGVQVKPLESQNDYTIRAKYQVKAALMHAKETELVNLEKQSVDMHLQSSL